MTQSLTAGPSLLPSGRRTSATAHIKLICNYRVKVARIFAFAGTFKTPRTKNPARWHNQGAESVRNESKVKLIFSVVIIIVPTFSFS